IRVLNEQIPTVFGSLGRPFNAPTFFSAREKSPNDVDIRTSVIDGVRRIIAWRTLPDYPLVVLTGVEEERVLATYNRSRPALLTGMATVSWLFVLAAFLLLRSFKRQAALSTSVREQARQLRAIMDNAPFEIFIKDRQGRYVAASRQSQDLRGI